MANSRTDTARDHDDSAMIDSILPDAAQQGRAGGNLATDVASAAERARVDDPEARTRVTKEDEIAHAADRGAERSGDA